MSVEIVIFFPDCFHTALRFLYRSASARGCPSNLNIFIPTTNTKNVSVVFGLPSRHGDSDSGAGVERVGCDAGVSVACVGLAFRDNAVLTLLMRLFIGVMTLGRRSSTPRSATPLGLPLEDNQLREISASSTTDRRRPLVIQRERGKSLSDEEMRLLQPRRCEMHRSRPWRPWSCGDWCWIWRSRAHSHRRTQEIRQFKDGAFLEPAKALLQEREGTREGWLSGKQLHATTTTTHQVILAVYDV